MSNNTQNLQIFNIIGQLEEMIERSPRPKLGGSGNKRVVDADEMIDLLGDLKVTIPEDIRRANSVMVESQSMIDNADEHAREVVADAEARSAQIIAGANEEAENILAEARREYERLVQQEEIYLEAQRRADLLAKKAEANANLVFESAKCYADDVLRDLESFLVEYKQLVAINRRDLDARGTRSAAPVQVPEQPVPAPQPQQSVQAAPAAQPQQPRRKAKPAPIEEYEDDFDDFDDEEDEKGGLFGGLFKRKKKIEDIDFDDEE